MPISRIGYPISVGGREHGSTWKDCEMGSMDESFTRSVLDDHVYKLLAASAVTLIVIGTVVYKLLEDWSWIDSVYFSVIAVTTVGFGDITPSTDASKLFTVVYVLAGISIITSYLHARMGRKNADRLQS
jgi:hypothetical protein